MQTAVSPLRSRCEFRPQPLKGVAIGDSLIYGFGDPIGGGWVERLRRQWMQPDGPVLYNLGVRGDGVNQVLQRLEPELRHRGELRNRLPDFMILSIGVNDSARLGRPDGRSVTPFEQFQATIAELLERSQRLCPVLFVGMVPVDESKMPFLDCFHYSHAEQFRYKEATRLACQARQIPYLDVFDRWRQWGDAWGQAQMSSDGLHPNVSGYQALLQEVLQWSALARLLPPSDRAQPR